MLGLDGLEPRLVEPMLQAGELPALSRLREAGAYGRVATTYPAQTPVAWSTFATGVNPGGHGIFDFLRRDPVTCLPDLALNRYEQKNKFVPPRAINLRHGTPLWDLLGAAGIPSVILRCPCTYPGESMTGRLLAGMGVPDLRGGLGTGTYYTTADGVTAGEGERVTRVTFSGGRVRAPLVGPRVPGGGDAVVDLVIESDPGGKRITVRAGPAAVTLAEGTWSGWLKVKFRLGLLQSVAGMVRFYLPPSSSGLALYASPVNFTPEAPPFPISAPWDYAGELQGDIGAYHTTGMVEDHAALVNGRLDEAAFLAQCETAMEEREAMLDRELARFREGLLFCLFDTPDRIQHLFWRFREPDHPANEGAGAADPAYRHVIEEHYRRCDGIVAKVLEAVGSDCVVIVLSDHGFTSFRRGIHLNGWLQQQGLLVLNPGANPADGGEFLGAVDWSRSKAYALGLGGIYLNRRGREERGILAPEDATSTAAAIQSALTGLIDPGSGRVAVRGVKRREEIYRGEYAEDAPDLLALFEHGYRASWTTALGGLGIGVFEDNTRRWGGDHIVDPALVPGVLFMNRPFDSSGGGLEDLAPTILSIFGVAPGPAMEGKNLLS